jgi:hypothetical protein
MQSLCIQFKYKCSPIHEERTRVVGKECNGIQPKKNGMSLPIGMSNRTTQFLPAEGHLCAVDHIIRHNTHSLSHTVCHCTKYRYSGEHCTTVLEYSLTTGFTVRGTGTDRSRNNKISTFTGNETAVNVVMCRMCTNKRHVAGGNGETMVVVKSVGNSTDGDYRQQVLGKGSHAEQQFWHLWTLFYY